MNLLASLVAATALVACGVDATPQSGGNTADVNSESARTQAPPAEQPAAEAEKAGAPQAKEEAEKKSE